MDAFVSYSVEDKAMGAIAKASLEAHGFECFLAHDDLQVSEEWKNRILAELRQTDVFVTLLSRAFVSSKWCAQEVGVIVSRPDVLIVPLSLDGTNPYGFISHLQGIRVRDQVHLAVILEEVLFRRRPRLMIPKQIEKMRAAGSFRGAEAVVKPLVPHFAQFSDDEVNAFASAAADNSEVWDASLCRSNYIPHFVRINGARITPTQAADLKAVIADLDLPHGDA